MLVWATPTQSAFATFEWLKKPFSGFNTIALRLTDAPWRASKPGFGTAWPAVITPTPDDEAKRRELFTLMEQLRPHSTNNIEQLKPAPAINLFETKPKNISAAKPKGLYIIIKPVK